MSQTYERILIIKPSSLGDIVQALPALSALHDSFPEARISWLVSPEFAPLLEGHPCLDEIINFPRQQIARAWRSAGGISALWDLRKDLLSRHFDVTFDFQGLLRSALAGWASRAPRRLGPANGREGAPCFYTDRVQQKGQSMHVVDHYLEMVRAAGGEVSGPPRFLFPSTRTADNQLAEIFTANAIESGRYVVLAAGSAHSDKCWAVERFAMLADRMHHHYGVPVLLIGTAAERPTAERIRSLAGEGIINVAGNTALPGLTALLREASLVVSNDTGPGHIAAGLGVPLVMLFSWSNPARIYPYGRRECMVAVDPFQRGDAIRSRDPRHNVSSITLEEVWERCQQQIPLPVQNEKPLSRSSSAKSADGSGSALLML